MAGVPERVMMMSQIDVVDDAIVPSGDSPVRQPGDAGQRAVPAGAGDHRGRGAALAALQLVLDLLPHAAGGHELQVINVDGNTPAAPFTADVADHAARRPDRRAGARRRAGRDHAGDDQLGGPGPVLPAQHGARSPRRCCGCAPSRRRHPSPRWRSHHAAADGPTCGRCPIDRRRELAPPGARAPRRRDRTTSSATSSTAPSSITDVVNQTMVLGTTEEWEIVNETYEPHPFHIHVNPFQIITIDGEPSGENFYRDSALVPPVRQHRDPPPVPRLHGPVRAALPHPLPRGPRHDAAARGRRVGLRRKLYRVSSPPPGRPPAGRPVPGTASRTRSRGPVCVEEVDRFRVTAVLAADAEFEVGLGLSALLGGDLAPTGRRRRRRWSRTATR